MRAVALLKTLYCTNLAQIICACAVASTFGCGPALPRAVVSSPFAEEDARYFDDGADFVADPTMLEGRWREEWADDFQGRIEKADVMVVVHISTVRTSVDLDHRTTYHLVPEPTQSLWEQLPPVELTVREGAPGYASVHASLERLQVGNYILFVKWYTTDTGDVGAHWHLSPGTQAVIDRTAYLIEHRRTPLEGRHRVTVITHSNDND
ncbi:MAG: hypothetical protein IPK60_01825 [Sandaracinaceae bacterium]|nr:hypothetical protein [Sandaracinaceae bacterium]